MGSLAKPVQRNSCAVDLASYQRGTLCPLEGWFYPLSNRYVYKQCVTSRFWGYPLPPLTSGVRSKIRDRRKEDIYLFTMKEFFFRFLFFSLSSRKVEGKIVFSKSDTEIYRWNGRDEFPNPLPRRPTYNISASLAALTSSPSVSPS